MAGKFELALLVCVCFPLLAKDFNVAVFLVYVSFCLDQKLPLAIGVSVGLLVLLLLGLMLYYLCRRKDQTQYEELLSTVPSVPACSAPVILVSQGSWTTLVP